VKLAKFSKWLKADPGTWFHRTGIISLFGAALTANFVVEFAMKSGAPLMVTFALLTALFLSLVIVVWDRAGAKTLILMSVLTLAGAVLTSMQVPSILTAPRLPDPSLALWVSLVFTIVAALLTLALWGKYGEKIYNPEITPVQNGITLIGVLLSALAFNLDSSWGPWIGWPVIGVTLFSLAPIWRSEAEMQDQIAELRRTIARLEEEGRELTPGKGSFSLKPGKRKGRRK
jgi:hypothetical protein